MYLSIQVSKSLGRVFGQMSTKDVSNHLINFPMCTECKEEGQKPIETKIKEYNAFTLFVLLKVKIIDH